MPDNQYTSFLIYIVLAMHFVWFFVEAGWLISHSREQQDRSRIFAGASALYGAIASLMFIMTAMFSGDLEGFTKTILQPYPVMLITVAVLLLMLYVLEIERPGWMTLKRLVLIMLPWIVLSLTWIIYHVIHLGQIDAITHLTSYEQIPANIHKTDVLLRVLMVAIFVPYGFAILLVCPDPKVRKTTGTGWLWWIKILSATSSVTYVLGLGLRITTALFVHLMLLDSLFVLIFVFESTIRNRSAAPSN